MSPVSLSIGERLKSARSAKGLSLEAVARTTKIQRGLLEAMEEDRLEEILDWAYAKIFLKKYAGHLGLDGAALVAEVLASRAPLEERLSGSVETPPLQPAGLIPRTAGPSPLARVLVPAGLGLLGLTGLAFLGYLVVDLQGNLRESRRLAGPSSAQGMKPKPEGPTVEKVPAAPKLIVPLSVPLKLTVSSKADVWMQIKADGTVIFQNVLAKGSRETWTAREELEIWTGNAGAMELSLNGRALGSPGSGVRKGIKVTREGLKQ